LLKWRRERLNRFWRRDCYIEWLLERLAECRRRKRDIFL
jgi:hypothetical protein